MTTPSTERKAGPLLGTGAQTTWPFTFKVFAETDIAVTIATSLGVETTLVYGVDYTVSLNANQETSPGGTVTYPVSGTPLPVGSRLVIIGNLPYDQPLDLPSGGNFNPVVIENELDRVTMLVQQLRERLSRAVQVSVTADADVILPPPAASQLIGWDTTGENLANVPLSALATAVGYGTYRYNTFTGDGAETEFALSENPGVLANLDVSISGVVQVPGTDYSLVGDSLVFASAPANGTTILARYGQALPSIPDSDQVSFVQAGSGAVTRTVQNKLRETVSCKDFGAIGDGVTDDTAAFQKAVTYLLSRNGGCVYIPHGQYLLNGTSGADGVINGILLPFTGGSDVGATAISVDLLGEDRDTTLLAGSNDMIVVRCSTSHSNIGNFQILANNKSGVTGIALIPQNTSSPALASQQSYNNVHDFYISACNEGIVLQCGGNGGAYYNEIGPGHIHGSSANNTRGVYLKTGVGGTGTPSNANRNHFLNVRVGYANTGFEIESGDTNRFTACSVEGISAGTAPNTTPTGVRIPNLDGNGRGNVSNFFYGFVAEGCTRDAELLNPNTGFFGFVLDASKTVLASTFVSGQSGTMIGSYDFTVFPNIYAGTIEYGSNLPSGIGSYEFGTARNGLEYFDKGYKYKSFPLSVSNVTGVNSIGESQSYYTRLANMVDWSFRFDFNPTSSSVVLTVKLPVTANLNAYATYNTINPFTFLVRLSAGASEVVGFAEVNWESPAGTWLKIRLPSGTSWNTSAGNNNRIDCAIRYRAA